jgi:acyl-CoA synthetase (AMP-forming)/AMP-acid ligase II
MVAVTSLLEQLQKTDNDCHLTMGGVRRDWSEMWRMAQRSAGWVQHHGGVVACLMENVHEAAAVVVGALLGGSKAVSLPMPHRGQALEEYVASTVRAAHLAGAGYVVCTHNTKALIESVGAAMPGIRVLSFEEVCAWGGSTREDGGGSLIQYTSGSTGAPRGIPLSDRHLGANVQAIGEYLGCDSNWSIASWLPLSHDMGLVGVTLTTWAVGGSADISSPEGFAARPLSWIQALSDTKASISAAPNFALELVLRSWSRAANKRYDLSAMRSLIVGGEMVYADTLRRLSAVLMEHGMKENVLAPSYGMAELGLAVSLGAPLTPWRIVGVDTQSIADGSPRVVGGAEDGLHFEGFADGVTEAVVSGRILNGYEVTAESDGSLLVDGPSLFDGYIGEPQRTGAHHTRDTGVVLDDGGVVVLGRSDDVIVVRGRNIHPADVELACGELVRRGLVAAVPDGQGGMAIVAEALAGEKSEYAAAVRQAATRASGVAASRVVFVHRGSLEKTPSGKVKRRSIAGKLHSGDLNVVYEQTFRHPS